MTIYLNKRSLYTNLFMGLLWTLMGTGHFILNDKPHWFGAGYYIVGSLELALFFYNYKHQYLRIDGDILIKNKTFGFRNKILLSEIKEIKMKSTGDYLLKSDYQTLKIDPKFLEPKEINKLGTILKDLDIPEELNYFSKFKNKSELTTSN